MLYFSVIRICIIYIILQVTQVSEAVAMKKTHTYCSISS